MNDGDPAAAAEMADALERRAVRYAMLDPGLPRVGVRGGRRRPGRVPHHAPEPPTGPGDYLAVGADRVILARTIHAASELESLHAALPMPLRVVRLSVRWPEIERRLGADVTSGRADDLRRAAEQL